MLLFGPTGTSNSSSQFRLKYAKTRLKVPSGFSSQPSYTGMRSSPFNPTICPLLSMKAVSVIARVNTSGVQLHFLARTRTFSMSTPYASEQMGWPEANESRSQVGPRLPGHQLVVVPRGRVGCRLLGPSRGHFLVILLRRQTYELR